MLGNHKGKRKNIYVPDYIVYDLETTGVLYARDRILEIGAVKVRGGQIVDEFVSLVNPERRIPEDAFFVSGINDDMVKDAPILVEVLPRFYDFIGEDVLVGHNIHIFDNRFIYRFSEE